MVVVAAAVVLFCDGGGGGDAMTSFSVGLSDSELILRNDKNMYFKQI